MNRNFFLCFKRDFFENCLLWVAPAVFFVIQLVWIFLKLPYFWYGEIAVLFILVVLFLFAEVNKIFNTPFCSKFGKSVVGKNVCLNIFALFFINTAFVIVLRFGGLMTPSTVLLHTENIYLGSSVLVDSVRIFIAFLFLVNIAYTFSYTSVRNDTPYEYYLFLGLLCAISSLTAACKNLFLLFLLVEAISFLLIGLVCFSRTKLGFEVALKFFVLSGLFTLIGLFGCVIVYSVFHTLDYRAIKLFSAALANGDVVFSQAQLGFLNTGVVFIFIALLFKLGSFPLHVYVADYASESLYPALFFFLVPLKVMFFFVISIIFIFFSHMSGLSSWIFLFCGLSSILVGAKSAIGENEIKKFLAFTSINQFGFALIALSVPSFTAVTSAYIFVFIYSISMAIFLFVPMRSFGKKNREAFLFLNHFAYYGRFERKRFRSQLFPLGSNDQKNNAFLKSAATLKEIFGPQFRLLLVVFSLIGIPPLPGFGAKFLIFFVLMQHHHVLTVFVILLISLISAFYYLNLIYKVFNKSESASFRLSENYFKWAKSRQLEYFQNALTALFVFLGILVLDMNFFFELARIISFNAF